MINNHYINKALGIPTRHVEQRFGQGVRLGRHSMKQRIDKPLSANLQFTIVTWRTISEQMV